MLKAKNLKSNFIKDKNICKKIINQTKIYKNIILEIGPGYGFLTDIILESYPKKIYLVEKDRELVSILKTKYRNNKNIIIIEKDILKYDLSNFKNLIIISNLPYNVSTKIILHLFNFNMNILEMILMVQREVALKFNYNLSNMNKYKFINKLVSNFSICFDVSPNVFIPKPKVISTVVKFELKKKNIDFEKINLFTNLIFKNIRKKISNNIRFKKKENLINKRVNELTIDDLLKIYNLF